MSQREFLIVLAHTHVCGMCRERLLQEGVGILSGRSLTPEEKSTLAGLTHENYVTPDALTRAAAVTAESLESFRDAPVVRLRHL